MIDERKDTGACQIGSAVSTAGQVPIMTVETNNKPHLLSSTLWFCLQQCSLAKSVLSCLSFHIFYSGELFQKFSWWSKGWLGSSLPWSASRSPLPSGTAVSRMRLLCWKSEWLLGWVGYNCGIKTFPSQITFEKDWGWISIFESLHTVFDWVGGSVWVSVINQLSLDRQLSWLIFFPAQWLENQLAAASGLRTQTGE